MVLRLAIGLAVLAAAIGAVVVSAGGSSAGQDCGQQVERGVLPEWARTGFSEREPRIAHVLGRNGELAAILFSDPLIEPPRGDEATNKILWVARRTPPPGPLKLTASDGSRTLRREVEGGPGPSSVDLPAGCWRIEASWPGGKDRLDLTYAPR
jgi:hypothetical protein